MSIAPTELEIEFKGHDLFVIVFVGFNYTRISEVYLSGTEIQIKDSLTSYQHDELLELVQNHLEPNYE